MRLRHAARLPRASTPNPVVGLRCASGTLQSLLVTLVLMPSVQKCFEGRHIALPVDATVALPIDATVALPIDATVALLIDATVALLVVAQPTAQRWLARSLATSVVTARSGSGGAVVTTLMLQPNMLGNYPVKTVVVGCIT
jgi:hypothetical protein